MQRRIYHHLKIIIYQLLNQIKTRRKYFIINQIDNHLNKIKVRIEVNQKSQRIIKIKYKDLLKRKRKLN
jgi:hypothetical protein